MNLKVLQILSLIWRSGADIYLDETDNRVAIKDQKLIPIEVMKAAEQNFQAIDEWFKSWENASSEKITIMKMIHQFCGWQPNDKIEQWFCAEEDSLMLFIDWTIVLAENGWTDIYDDYREYENAESHVIAKDLYNRAITYAKQKKV